MDDVRVWLPLAMALTGFMFTLGYCAGWYNHERYRRERQRDDLTAAVEYSLESLF